MNPYFPHLFEPITVGKTVFRNRIFGAPHYAGVPFPGSNRHSMHIEALAEEARGGCAQVTIGDTMVDPIYGIQPWEPMVVSQPLDSMFLGECAAAIQQFSAKAFIKLDHPGQFAVVPQPIGPMALDLPNGAKVLAMTEEHMRHVAQCFAESCAAMKRVGFDGVMIHGGHGWLLQQFASPHFNQRTDEYGGSTENRARFPVMVVKAIREAVGPDFVVEYRISGDEHVDDGLTPEMTGEFLRYLEPYIDMVNVSGALECDPMLTNVTIPSIYQPYGTHLAAAAVIKEMLSIPVIAVGAIQSPERAEEILAAGKADVIMLGRPLMADPELPEKARSGHADDIAPCTRCLCCLGESESFKTFNCSVNPTFLRQYRLRYEYAQKPEPKKVLVIGGGLAGVEPAIELAHRGYDVTVLEALKGFARDAHRMNSLALLTESRKLTNLHAYDETTVTEITPDAVLARGKNGDTVRFEADNVVYAVGLRAKPQLYLALQDAAQTVVAIGDCVKPRRSMEAIREGYFAAMNL